MTAPALVYEDELVQIWHGDYRDGLAELPAEVGAVVTDPPYGETSLDWDRWPSGWVSDAAQIASSLWCFGSLRMFFDHVADFAPWKFSHEVVWEKHNGSGFAADKFRRVHELATFWYRGDWAEVHHEVPTTPDAVKRTVRRKERPPHLGEIVGTRYTSVDGGDRLARSVMRVRSEHGRAIHPTQKPEGILTPLIEYSVPRGGLVVDLFSGSGAVALAARHAGRRCIAFEAQKSYALASAKRLAQQAFDLGGIA